MWVWCAVHRVGVLNGDVAKRPNKIPMAQGSVRPRATLPSSLKMGVVYR